MFQALQQVVHSDLEREVFIRNQGHSVVEAINRQLCHYAYHVGQIVFLGKMVCKEAWTSLSIPKNSSAAYNAEKFSTAKSAKHFTEEYLDKNASDPAL